MAVEDFVTGAAIALAATWLASWLHKRETSAERTAQENRLRALLASEIESNLASVFISHRVDAEMALAGTVVAPTYSEPNRETYNTLASSPTSLPSEETLAVGAFYTWLEVTTETARTMVGVSDPDVQRAMADLWENIPRVLVKVGIAALESLKATAAVASVKAEAAQIGWNRDNVGNKG